MFKRRAKVPTEKQLQLQGGHQPKQAVLRADYEPSFDGCLAAPAGRVVTVLEAAPGAPWHLCRDADGQVG